MSSAFPVTNLEVVDSGISPPYSALYECLCFCPSSSISRPKNISRVIHASTASLFSDRYRDLFTDTCNNDMDIVPSWVKFVIILALLP